VAQSSTGIITLTLPSGYHRRNSVNDNIDNVILLLLLISVSVL